MKLYIKNMVSLCCKLMVEEKFKNLGLTPSHVALGEVTLTQELNSDQIQKVKESMLSIGFELMQDKTTTLIEKIKSTIRELVFNLDDKPESNYSDYLSEQLEHEYSFISSIFSKETGSTIQQFIIFQKIERAKTLINQDISLKEISYILHYSSVAHFCTQFKKVTGLTPTYFKTLSDPFVVDKIIGSISSTSGEGS